MWLFRIISKFNLTLKYIESNLIMYFQRVKLNYMLALNFVPFTQKLINNNKRQTLNCNTFASKYELTGGICETINNVYLV